MDIIVKMDQDMEHLQMISFGKLLIGSMQMCLTLNEKSLFFLSNVFGKSYTNISKIELQIVNKCMRNGTMWMCSLFLCEITPT